MINNADALNWNKERLEYQDVFPYIYCIYYFEGIESFNLVKHLVIDEMQDYSPVHYAVINKIFRCKKTILGDFGQMLNPFSLNSDQSFSNIFDRMEFVELKKVIDPLMKLSLLRSSLCRITPSKQLIAMEKNQKLYRIQTSIL